MSWIYPEELLKGIITLNRQCVSSALKRKIIFCVCAVFFLCGLMQGRYAAYSVQQGSLSADHDQTWMWMNDIVKDTPCAKESGSLFKDLVSLQAVVHSCSVQERRLFHLISGFEAAGFAAVLVLLLCGCMRVFWRDHRSVCVSLIQYIHLSDGGKPELVFAL